MKHMLVTKFLIVMVGMWRSQFKSFNNFQNKMYYLHCFFMQTTYMTFLMCLFIGIYGEKDNFDKFMEALAALILCLIIGIKILICQKKNIVKQLAQIVEFDNKADKLDTENYKKYQSYAVYTNYIGIMLFAFSSLCGVTLIGSKFIVYLQQLRDASNGLLNITEIEKPLPYIIWRPVDWREHYIIAFMLDVFSAIVGCSFNTVTQLIFFSIMTFLAGQLEILQIKFRCYGNLCSQKNTFEEKFEILRNLIIEHQQLITFAEELDENMKYLILLEFSINSLLITAILYQLLFFQVDAIIIFRLTYLCCMLFQMFILAYHANEVRLQSMELSQAVYECEWYDIPESLKKMLILIMMRSTRPLKVSVGPFFILTNDTAVTSVKGAYSYFTLLKNRQSRE